MPADAAGAAAPPTIIGQATAPITAPVAAHRMTGSKVPAVDDVLRGCADADGATTEALTISADAMMVVASITVGASGSNVDTYILEIDGAGRIAAGQSHIFRPGQLMEVEFRAVDGDLQNLQCAGGDQISGPIIIDEQV